MLAYPLCLALALSLSTSLEEEPPARRGREAPENLRALARQIGSRVEQIRGLEFRRPVEVRLVDEATARDHFRDRLQTFWPLDELRLEERAYVQVGLLPPGTDLLAELLDLLEEQAWGYYDPRRDTFYVLDRVPPESASILMAHELTHALDDQHFGIDARLRELRVDEDRELAFAAVVEGSGTLVMTTFMVEEIRAGRMDREAVEQIEQSEAGRAERLKAAPPLLRRSLLAPYVLGLRFLLRGNPRSLAAGLREQDLNRAFSDPPVSSEQLLHPAKYWEQAQRDPPQEIAIPDQRAVLGDGWSLAWSGTLGELNLAQLAGSRGPNLDLPEPTALEQWTNAAASGLAGDGYQHYVNGTRGLTLLATLWDSARDAAEFRGALENIPGRLVFSRDRGVVIVAGDLEKRAAALGVEALTVLLASVSEPES